MNELISSAEATSLDPRVKIVAAWVMRSVARRRFVIADLLASLDELSITKENK